MSEDNIVKIIVAIIALFGTILGLILGIIAKNRKQAAEDARREQEQKDAFSQLFIEMNEVKKRLDLHNHYAEKFGEIDKSLVSIRKDIEYMKDAQAKCIQKG